MTTFCLLYCSDGKRKKWRLKTLIVDLLRLHNCGEAAGIVVRLMMACNDLIVVNHCLGLFKEDLPRARRHTQWGTKLYFARLQCGHLREALLVVKELRDTVDLLKEVGRCSDTARQAFDRLVACLEGGPDHEKFKQYVEVLRHNVFHYDKRLVMKSLSDRAKRSEAKNSTITEGDEMCLWRFGVADDIYDSMVCRYIWKIPRKSDLREKADEVASWQFGVFKSFLEFSGDFIERYIRGHAAA